MLSVGSGAAGGLTVLIDSARGLGRFSGGGDVWRRRRRVLLGALTKVLAVDQCLVQSTASYSLYYVNEVSVHRLIGKQTLVQFTLNLPGERGPVAADGFHANEF